MTVTVLDADYPPDLLQTQATAMGSESPSGIRGLQVSPYQPDKNNPTSSFLRASFAVDGLIDQQGMLHIEPLARALAGAPAPHTIHQFFVEFEGATIAPTTLGDFSSPSVLVTRDVQGPRVEYAVTLYSQVPAAIQIPDSNAPITTITPLDQPKKEKGTDWVTLTAYIVAAVAGGALVYCLLLILLRANPRNKPPR